MQDYRCPNCGYDGIQKVSAIYNAGAWSSSSLSSATTSGYSSSGAHYSATSYGSGISAGSTQLASRLRPPGTPIEMYRCGSFEAQMLALLTLICAAPVAVSLLFLPLPILSAYCFFAARRCEGVVISRQMQEQLVRWRQAKAVWNRLWYCGRCDHIHDPEIRKAVPSDQMQYLLAAVKPDIVDNGYPIGMWVVSPHGIGLIGCPNGDPIMTAATHTRGVLIVARPGRVLPLARLFCTKKVVVPYGLLRKVQPGISRKDAARQVREMIQEQADYDVRRLKALNLAEALEHDATDVADAVRVQGYSGPVAQTLITIIGRGYRTYEDMWYADLYIGQAGKAASDEREYHKNLNTVLDDSFPLEEADSDERD